MDAATKQPHGKNLRKGRASLPGHVYLVTAVTVSRKPFFANFPAARIAVRCFHDGDVMHHAQTLAFVVMPDHMHWLFQIKEGGDLPKVVRLYKAKVSTMLGQTIWQRGFHDHALRDDEDMRDIARYIVANPVRSGLVRSVKAYPHWDAIWL